MGVFERDYMRPEFRGGPPSGGPRSWSVVTWLIVINVALFMPRFFSDAEGSLVSSLESFGSLSWLQLAAGKIWTPVSYMFLHGSLMHLAGNMFVLFFAGRHILAMLGQRHFLAIYFGGGVVGGLVQVFLGMLIGWNNPLIGASAGVIATVIALTALMPEQKVYLLLFFVIPIRMKMKTLALIFVVLDILMLCGDLLGWVDLGIGNLAHLGGALFGWLYVKRGLPRSVRRRPSTDQSERWANRFGGKRVVDAEVTGASAGKKSWFTSAKKKPYISKSVDEILEKISAHGMQSLTDEERQVLAKNSEELARMSKRAGNR